MHRRKCSIKSTLRRFKANCNNRMNNRERCRHQRPQGRKRKEEKGGEGKGGSGGGYGRVGGEEGEKWHAGAW